LPLDVVLGLPVDLTEEPERVLVLTVPVLVATEKIVELPEQIALVGVVESRDLLVVVLADALDDVGGLGQVGRELRKPEERLVELEVVRLVGNLAEVGVSGLVELEAVERNREMILGELLVAFVVARLAFVDAIECEGRFAPLFPVEEMLGLRGLFGHLPRCGWGRVVDHLLGRCRSGRVELDLSLGRGDHRGGGRRLRWLLRLRLRARPDAHEHEGRRQQANAN